MQEKLHKPLVILAGWLGCKPRSLRRYQQFYDRLGWQTLSVVAAPSMVVKQCLGSKESELKIPKDWPKSAKSAATSMTDLAWSVWGLSCQRRPPSIVVHVFSNGGCLLWEQMKLVLDADFQDGWSKQTLADLETKVVGVVFDSCPSERFTEIGKALNYCSAKEQIAATWQGGWDFWTLPLRQSVRTRMQKRGDEYFERLKQDDSGTPQLYLCSENDDLAPIENIRDLVRSRKEKVGDDMVWIHVWKDSPHCAHLRTDPRTYETILESFLLKAEATANTIRARL